LPCWWMLSSNIPSHMLCVCMLRAFCLI
jgi:hypothetical protein